MSESVTIKLCHFRLIIVAQNNLAYQVIRTFTSVKSLQQWPQNFSWRQTKRVIFRQTCKDLGHVQQNFLRTQSNKLECLSLTVISTLVYYLRGRPGAYPQSASIRLGWKLMTINGLGIIQ